MSPARGGARPARTYESDLAEPIETDGTEGPVDDVSGAKERYAGVANGKADGPDRQALPRHPVEPESGGGDPVEQEPP